jgi:hypothetical protein
MKEYAVEKERHVPDKSPKQSLYPDLPPWHWEFDLFRDGRHQTHFSACHSLAAGYTIPAPRSLQASLRNSVDIRMLKPLSVWYRIIHSLLGRSKLRSPMEWWVSFMCLIHICTYRKEMMLHL